MHTIRQIYLPTSKTKLADVLASMLSSYSALRPNVKYAMRILLSDFHFPQIPIRHFLIPWSLPFLLVFEILQKIG